MFRRITLLALSFGAVGTIGAQSTEIIIRRSGQQDQVIKLEDKQAREMATKVSDQLRGAIKQLKDVEVARNGENLRFTFDTGRMAIAGRAMAGQLEELATHSAELASRTANLDARTAEVRARAGEMVKSSTAMMARVARAAMAQPRIGIGLNNNSSQDTDKFGALVVSVSPGGPADKAGIRSGDIITKVDGKSLASTSGKDESLPGMRLIEIVTKLQVGKPVPVEYRRGTVSHTTKVTPVEEDEIALSDLSPMISLRADTMRPRTGVLMPRGMTGTRTPMPAIDHNSITLFEDAIPGVPGGNFTYAFSNGGPLGSLELVSLNEKLGTYFGTSEGVLVVNVGSKDAFGLTPGDVIVSVDGRKVNASSQLMRILRTYDKGEEFKIQILRQKKAETLTGKLP